MLAFAYYVLKVTICSAFLYGYYRIALHNKIYHYWNRFYLLLAVLLSITIPLIRIQLWQHPQDESSQVIRILRVVSTGEEMVFETGQRPGYHLDAQQALSLVYFMISILFLSVFVRSLLVIRKLILRHETQKINNINFVNTEADGTPFSFFNYIFWNKAIEIHTLSGQQIFRHELAHVQQKHSWDKLFMNFTLLIFWCNPFFWLIRKELNMIHEFIADGKALKEYDTASFAAMVLHSVYPGQKFSITNSFFYSPIKRRLHMLTKLQNPKVSYISRVLVLPLLTFVFIAFTGKTRQLNSQAWDRSPLLLNTSVTIVIDAGHGGADGGVKAKDGTFEKDINLSIARKIRDLNTNENLRILLTRDKDISLPVQERARFAEKSNASAFVSLHVNTASPESADSAGFEVFISSRNNSIQNSSALLGSLFINEMKNFYPVSGQLKKRTESGIWVLDAPGIQYAAILIECGYMSNASDMKFIEDERNQEAIATRVLRSLEKFAAQSGKPQAFNAPELPSRDHVQVSPDQQ